MKVYLVCHLANNGCGCSNEELVIRGICQSESEAKKIFNQIDMKINGYDLCIKEVEMDTLFDSGDLIYEINAPQREKELQARMLYRKQKEDLIKQKHKEKYDNTVCLI